MVENLESRLIRRRGECRIGLLVIIYNIFLMLFCLVFCHRVYPQSLVVIIFHSLLVLFHARIGGLSHGKRYLLESIGLVVFMWFNYQIVGAIDRGLGGLAVHDLTLAKIDEAIFHGPAASFFQNSLFHLLGGELRKLFYDVLMVSYMSYYFLPFLGSLLYMSRAIDGQSEDEKIQTFVERGRFLASVTILCLLTFTFYLIIPVTGPQYFLLSYFARGENLPFTFFGRSIYNFVYSLQPNYIDCFPSGHAGLAYLVCFWMYKGNFRSKHLFLLAALLITFATVLLRFHYTMDIMASVPFAVLSYFLGRTFFPPLPKKMGING